MANGQQVDAQEWKRQFDAALKKVADAQNALTAVQQQLTQAQAALRELGDRPPGEAPGLGGP